MKKGKIHPNSNTNNLSKNKSTDYKNREVSMNSRDNVGS